MIELIIKMIGSHILADFVFQSDTMAKMKNRHYIDPELKKRFGKKYKPSWYFWLSAHALTHGIVLFLLTGIWELFIIESIAHFIIDFMKCEKWTTMKLDQALHYITKSIYIILIYLGVIGWQL